MLGWQGCFLDRLGFSYEQLFATGNPQARASQGARPPGTLGEAKLWPSPLTTGGDFGQPEACTMPVDASGFPTYSRRI